MTRRKPAKPAKRRPRGTDRSESERLDLHRVIREVVAARAASQVTAAQRRGFTLAAMLRPALPPAPRAAASLVRRLGDIPGRRLPPPVTLRSAPPKLSPTG